jgi:hypothetical protein
MDKRNRAKRDRISVPVQRFSWLIDLLQDGWLWLSWPDSLSSCMELAHDVQPVESVRRLAFEAPHSALLSPEIAAGIRRVKGVRKLGSRWGNWLTAAEASALWPIPNPRTLTGKRKSSYSCHSARLRPVPPRTCRTNPGELAASRGSLGCCGSDRQGKAHTNCSDTILGEKDARSCSRPSMLESRIAKISSVTLYYVGATTEVVALLSYESENDGDLRW